LNSYLGGPAAGALLWANDFSFAGTAWAGAVNRHPTSFSLIVFNDFGDGNPAHTFVTRVHVQIYTGSHFNYNGTGAWGTQMDDPAITASNPIFDGYFTSGAYHQNEGNFETVNFPATFNFPDGTDQFFVKFSFVDASGATNNPAAAGTAEWGFSQSAAATPTNAAGPGVDSPELARDQNASGILDGSATIGGTSDHRSNLNGTTAISPSWQVNYSPPVVLPTPTHDFGCLPDGTTSRAVDSIGANQLVWYKFCLNGDALDTAGANGQFVDMHTHGSNFDTMMGLYDNSGQLLWTADDDGTDLQSMLSFGMGRRAAIGAGLERDGFGFTTGPGLPAAPGPYWLGVAGFGVSFQNAFGTAGTWGGGNISVGFETNINGATLASSVAPVPEVDGGVLLFPGGQLPSVATDTVPNPRWMKFNLCRTTSATNTVAFDFTPCDNRVQWGWGLFNASGNLVTNAATASTPPTVTFDGSTPALTLTSGDYYLALVYNYGIDYGQHPATAGRWHIRGRAVSNYPNGVQVGVSWSDCPAAGGCTADFNCDGDVGTDADISSFFACLSGTCPAAPCANTADFNNDGDVGTDADIASFFRVLSGGPC
jgi:hypothetical protein